MLAFPQPADAQHPASAPTGLVTDVPVARATGVDAALSPGEHEALHPRAVRHSLVHLRKLLVERSLALAVRQAVMASNLKRSME